MATTRIDLDSQAALASATAQILAANCVTNTKVDAAAAIDGTKISPDFGSQAVTTSGNMSTTGSGTMTSAGLLTGQAGLTVSAGAVSLPASSLSIENFSRPVQTNHVADAATTGNITLSGSQTIDGFAATDGNTVLVKNQTVASENGIWNASNNPWTRYTHMNSSSEFASDSKVYVTNGTTQGGKTFTLSTNTIPFVVDTSSLTFNPEVNVIVTRASTSGTGDRLLGGAIDGVNAAFTLAQTPITFSEEVFKNGILQEDGGGDYSISGVTITFNTAPLITDKLAVNYRY